MLLAQVRPKAHARVPPHLMGRRQSLGRAHSAQPRHGLLVKLLDHRIARHRVEYSIAARDRHRASR
jgi:hypothetical protein